MSIRIMSQAWDVVLCDSEKLILLALADWSNDDGHCWPSVGQLAKKCSKGERTIQGALKSLEAGGHITREQRPGKGCNYLVHPRNPCTPAAAAPRRDCAPAETAPPQEATPTPAAAAPNTSGNTKPPKAKASGGTRAKPKAHLIDLPDWLPITDWDAFVEMRRAMERGPKKIPFTVDAMKGIIRELAKGHDAGHDVAAMLQRSVVNGYRGVFVPDGPPPAKASQPASEIDREAAAAFAEAKRAYDAGEITFDDMMSRKPKPPDEPRRQFTGPRPIGSLVQRIQDKAA